MQSTRSLLTSFRKSPVSVPPGWALAYGQVNTAGEDFSWRDEDVALLQTQPAFSPQQRFVVTGDVWLSNRKQLLCELEAHANPQGWSDLQIIAALWEIGSKSMPGQM